MKKAMYSTVNKKNLNLQGAVNKSHGKAVRKGETLY